MPIEFVIIRNADFACSSQKQIFSPGGGLRHPHPHFQSAASAASENGFISRKCVKNTFFHEWAPYGRWGGHRTVKIRVVAMRVFFIFIIS